LSDITDAGFSAAMQVHRCLVSPSSVATSTLQPLLCKEGRGEVDPKQKPSTPPNLPLQRGGILWGPYKGEEYCGGLIARCLGRSPLPDRHGSFDNALASA